MTERPNKHQRSESYGDGGIQAVRIFGSKVSAKAYVAYHSLDLNLESYVFAFFA